MNRILRRAVAAFNARDDRRRRRRSPGYATGPLTTPHRPAVVRPVVVAAPSRTVPLTDGRESLTALAAATGVLIDRRAPIYTESAIEAAVREGMRLHADRLAVRECRADDLPFDQEAAEVADAAERIANGEAA